MQRGSREETTPLPAVGERERDALAYWLVAFIFIFVMERKMYPMFISFDPNKFVGCIRNKVERRVFLVFPPSQYKNSYVELRDMKCVT